ncbi:MFS general substrate transporter [Saitoella complicata NRRL Y-17804]|nr:MFS general substrate transporter [Saitoella complicata NRRL Y-17804]ODQ54687.1 MFS general substrate transporter [Saitoella complicata NRRL Y-17804]
MSTFPVESELAHPKPVVVDVDGNRDEEKELARIVAASHSPSEISDDFTLIASNEHFVRDLAYTLEEEHKVRRKLDTHLMPWILLTTFILNMDRTNNSNAISAGLPADLGFTIDAVNNATLIYALVFTLATFSGAIIAKQVGPHRWIPILMFAWGIVTWSHIFIKNVGGYYAVRFFIALTEGGVIPATLIYLGGYYSTKELAVRLATFWGVQSVASAVSGLMAAGILKMNGISGLEGWKWLFLIDGVITNVVAILTFFYLPSGPGRTKGGLRGPKGWFTDRQVKIAVTRLIRDDPVKSDYEQKVTWSDIRDAAIDPRLWAHLVLTFVGMMPITPLQTYMPTVIKTFGYNVFVSNALTAPPYLLQMVASVALCWNSDRVGERGFHGVFGAAWFMVGWIMLRALPETSSKGVRYLAILIAGGWPITHPLNIAWMTENMAPLGKRTVASGAIIGAANLFAVPGAYIYRADDQPYFHRGNSVLIALTASSIVIWISLKFWYRHTNRVREERWASFTHEVQVEYVKNTSDKGNQRLDFRFRN